MSALLSAYPESAVSRTASGTLRSIRTLPAINRIERARAASNMASTELLCVVANTMAVVVPLRSSSSRKNSATSRAWSSASNLASAGKV